MAFSDKDKVKLLKEILIARIDSYGSLSAMKTFIKNLTWTKLKIVLKNDIQERANIKALESVDNLVDETDLLEVKDEINEY